VSSLPAWFTTSTARSTTCWPLTSSAGDGGEGEHVLAPVQLAEPHEKLAMSLRPSSQSESAVQVADAQVAHAEHVGLAGRLRPVGAMSRHELVVHRRAPVPFRKSVVRSKTVVSPTASCRAWVSHPPFPYSCVPRLPVKRLLSRKAHVNRADHLR
jgi:hypothetical protein